MIYSLTVHSELVLIINLIKRGGLAVLYKIKSTSTPFGYGKRLNQSGVRGNMSLGANYFSGKDK